jgi:general secretion pathway protein D
MMIRPDMKRRAWAVILCAALVGPGCAARMDYRRGQAEAKNGNWDMAVARLTRALQRDPDNIGYKIALENARIQASRQHATLARKHLAANELDLAAEELEIASKYDPSNKSASDDLAVVRGQIRKREEEKERLAAFDETKARAAALPVMPVLSPRSPNPILLTWGPDQSLQKLLETLGRVAGVNIVFDDTFRDKNVSVKLNNITFQEALDQITQVNRLFYRVLDQNTLLIIPEQQRRTRDDAVLRTFYIQNADVKEIEAVLKSALGTGPRMVSNPTLGAITVVGTPDVIALAQRVLDLNDKPRGEVVIEVQVMEINRDKAKRYGLELANYGAGAAFSPTGADNEITEDGFTNVRAHMLSSLSLADFVVSVPSAIFTQFLQTDAINKIVAAPKLRAAEGKKASLKIGREVPVPTTTFQSTSTGGGTFTPATNFNYRNVGVTMDITPKVSASGDITLDTTAEFSLLGGNIPVAGAGDLPTFLTRTVTGQVRVRDGETVLLGGLLQQDESDSMRGILGLQDIPILNSVFSSRTKSHTTTEVVISMTPHLVRAPKITADDLVGLNIGTTELIRLKGARPPLFGPAPEEVPAPTASPGPAASSTAKPTPVTPSIQPTQPAAPNGISPPRPGTLTAPENAAGASATVGLPTAPMPSPTPTPAPAEPPADAAPTAARPVIATLAPPVATARVGDTTSLGIVVQGIQGVTAIEAILSFDASALEAVDVAAGSLLTLDGSAVGAEKTIEANRVRARFTRSVPAAGSGVIATFTFRTLRNGTSSVKVEALSLSSTGGTVVPTVPSPAQVNVQ